MPAFDFDAELGNSSELVVTQRRELGELLGVETRNKYEIATTGGRRVGFAAEQQKGFVGFLFRQALGHWRTFDVTVFDEGRQPVLHAHHPFRWFFQRLEVQSADGRRLGAIQRRWGILKRVFDVEDEAGRVVLRVQSPIWKPWTFEFLRDERPAALVKKKWSGLVREAFMDADNFAVAFTPGPVSVNERKLLLAAAIFIDLMYFEKKSG